MPETELNGTDILVLWEDPAIPGTFQTLASQRGGTLNENTDPIDVSSKASRKGKFKPGRYSATLDLNMLYVPDSADFLMMRTAMRDGDMVKLRRSEGGTDIEDIDAVIVSMPSDFPDQDAAVVAAGFQLSGEWSAAP